MDLLNSLGKGIEKIDSVARAVKIFWLVNTTKSFPPLTVDIARGICEFAAELDAATARNLYITSKDIRSWVTPILFRRLYIPRYNYLLFLKEPETLERIAPHIHSVSLRPRLGDAWKQDPTNMAMEFNSFLIALPNLVHFCGPYLPRHSRWAKVPIVLPSPVFSLDIHHSYLEEPQGRNFNFNRTRITHIHSDLIYPPYASFFTDWSALTHLFFEIRPQSYLDASIARSTFPVSLHPFSRLPTSIVSCVLMDAQSSAWDFKWAIDQALVDLVLGDADPRVVFAAGETREHWMVVGVPAVTPEKDLSWIRIGLQDAILYHNHNQQSYKSIWELAEVVRRKRSQVEVREAVYQLLQHES